MKLSEVIKNMIFKRKYKGKILQTTPSISEIIEELKDIRKNNKELLFYVITPDGYVYNVNGCHVTSYKNMFEHKENEETPNEKNYSEELVCVLELD